ncbi:MAG: two-component system, OmpR family, response regulator MprA [Chloroflexota bacterium]|nr:two-component system, OmpR family, response regulator MprA [Chloroflexota bacterium]
MPNRSRPVLVVDDNDATRETVALVVGDEGHPTAVARDSTEALASLDWVRPWVVVADLQMPGLDGDQLVGALRERMPGLPAVIMTGRPDARDLIEAVPAQYLAKPFSLDQLFAAIDAATRSTR